jgi:two-component system sensor histidine kinase PilS (NtrC family)
VSAAQQASDRPEGDLGRKARIVFLFRFLIALACATALAIIEGGDVFSSHRFRYAYILLLGSCVLDLAYVPLLRHLGLRSFQVLLHVVVDFLVISALVYLTGGTSSEFILLYFAPLLAAAYLLPFNLGISAPLLAILGHLVVVGIFHWAPGARALPFVSPEIGESFLKNHEDLSPLLGGLFLRALAFLAVFILGTRLLRSVSEERIVISEIIESMGEGILTIDRAGRLALVNRSARLILGLNPRANLSGRPIREVFGGGEMGELARRLLEGKDRQFETILHQGKGRPLAVQVATWPIEDEKEKSRGTVAIVKDLTLEKEIEEIRSTADRLKGIREMAAGIAHEIRNPLASIRGSIQELSTGAAVEDEDRKLMSIILKESDRLDNIITEFLELTSRRTLSPRAVDLAEIIEDVALLLSKRPEKKRSKIRTELGEDLTARVDVEQIREVFFNLGINALQAMSNPGVLLIKAHPLESYIPVDAEGLSRKKAPGISISFMDTGAGIDADTLKKILTPFFSTKPKGTGIGLALVQRTVDAHGGTLSVDSSEGTGTTFTLWIPRNLEGRDFSALGEEPPEGRGEPST